MPRISPLAVALAAALFLAGCQDHPAAPAGPSTTSDLATAGGEAADRARLEALARHLAQALAAPGFRDEVLARVRASRHPEGKVHFNRWLEAGHGKALTALARAAGLGEGSVRELASEGTPLELYLPVASQRAAWQGSDDILVATSLRDHERPVAFDVRGERRVLDADTPPAEPVLALVPLESNLDPGPGFAKCQEESCSGGGGGGSAGGGDGGEPTPSLANQHLKLTYAWFADDFEGWTRGDPEYEIHILGPTSSDADADYASFQCIGEHAPTGYGWNQNGSSWTGNQLLFTGTQLDALEAAFPGRSFTVLALEDDDTSCEIKMDRDLVGNFFKALTTIYGAYRGAKDIKVLTPTGIKRSVEAGKAGFNFITALAALWRTNDDLIGAALADTVAGRAHPIGNWAVMRDNAVNGWLRLEVGQ